MKAMGTCFILILLLCHMGYALEFDATTGSFVEANNPVPIFPDSALLYAFPSPDGAPRGLAYDGVYLWCANSGDGNSSNGKKIYKLDATTGAILNTYVTPGNTNPYGLAWDGSYLWHSDFGTDMIYKIDTTTMNSVYSFSYGSGLAFDLAWDGTYLWAAFGNSDIIVAYDVNSGTRVDTIIANYTSPEVRPMGLCYTPDNSGQIWTCDGSTAGLSNLVSQWDFSYSSWVNQWSAAPAFYPAGMEYDSLTGRVWVSCWTNDSIYVFHMQANEVEEETADNPALHSCAFSNADGFIRVHFSLPEYACVSVKLYNLSGRLINTVERNFDKGDHSISFDSNGIPSGIYFTNFSVSGFTKTQRIIIAR
ncbi:T9SS type A sorting domain-containing protein [candidate division WOR-3 bacterium]|nr:T9SS type A sorting domain-containing protein [candidate division WOR-3 bacterium]